MTTPSDLSEVPQHVAQSVQQARDAVARVHPRGGVDLDAHLDEDDLIGFLMALSHWLGTLDITLEPGVEVGVQQLTRSLPAPTGPAIRSDRERRARTREALA
ncbi:hypothetical protein KLP28_08625 [Nocardioidaceae bacterium]|nr:hypothetical protein KLP28_08625 [Nocardioidaceae bacterium]